MLKVNNEVGHGYTASMKISKFLFISGVLALSLVTLPASAHTVLASADPAENSTVDILPAEISITFAEELISIGYLKLLLRGNRLFRLSFPYEKEQ